MEPLLADMLQWYVDNQCIDKIGEIHPTLYHELLSNGFIRDDSYDEFLELEKMMRNINEDTSFYRLIINPTINCNFNCWYCYEDHSIKTKMNHDIQQRILKFVSNTIKSNEIKRFQLSFFGGEPLLYYSQVILPIANYTSQLAKEMNKEFIFDITSNGYLFTYEKLEELKKIGLTSCQITLDGNKKEHNNTRFTSSNKGSYEKIIENIKISVKLGIEIVLRINFSEKNVYGLSDILSALNDLKVSERKKNYTFNE
jgi:uncharacterized protein